MSIAVRTASSIRGKNRLASTDVRSLLSNRGHAAGDGEGGTRRFVSAIPRAGDFKPFRTAWPRLASPQQEGPPGLATRMRGPGTLCRPRCSSPSTPLQPRRCE